MIRLAHIVDTHAAELIAQDSHRLLPSQLAALSAFQICRSSMSLKMQLGCDTCQAQSYLPHSCGHRHCPHVHLVMPSAAFDNKRRLWRNKDGGYLFDHTALAKVFRAKMLAGIKQAGLKLPDAYPTKWVVDCKAVGSGQQAPIYLGRYLYRGVIQEKDILSCDKGNVTFRYQNSETRKMETRTLSGVAFLHLILQHILPKGYRRARNFGFLHPNSKLIPLVQLIKRVVLPLQQPRPASRCKCCGGEMKIIRTRIKTFIHRSRTLASNGEMAM